MTRPSCPKVRRIFPTFWASSFPAPPRPEADPQGALIDADMGAYLTWVNQQRLAGADKASFLVWFEDHTEALAIGPSLPRGTESNSALDLQQVLSQIV